MQLVLVSVAGLIALSALVSAILLYRKESGRSRRTEAFPPVNVTAEPPRIPAMTLACPSCRREYPAGYRFCPTDARALVPVGENASRSLGSGVTCPSCRRSFDFQTKFCPFDSEELVPTGMAAAVAARAVAGGATSVMGKICPSCAQKYELDATFCGRDGSELVSVN